MKRLLTIIFLVALSVLITSCGGKKETKKVSEDSKIATEAFALADQVRDAYLKRDLKAIEGSVTREGYRSLRSAIKSFDYAELDFNPVWVEIERDEVHLNVSWQGKWRRGEKVTNERGMAIFVMKGRPLKLDNILRANPFIYPE